MSKSSHDLPEPVGFATKSIHVGQNPEQWDSKCVVPPIFLSTTYKQTAPNEFKKYEYGRLANPSRDTLEECLAALEGAKYGITYSAGVGAINGLLSILVTGDHMIIAEDIYGGTTKLFRQFCAKYNVEISYIDLTDIKCVEEAIQKNTKLIMAESPANPTMRVTDIKALAEVTKKNNIVLAVDNTFLTSFFQRPLELGADVSIYSLTKYMNGHTDVIMGAALTNNDSLEEKLRFQQDAGGMHPSPFDCYLVNRSLKTLVLRMRQHAYNGLEVAKYLEAHPKIRKVLHPGLPSHPQHEISKKQTSGHSGMISFYLEGDLSHSRKFLAGLKLFTLANSLGGNESLIEMPFLMTHNKVSAERKAKLEITESMMRMSVGLEDIQDLIDDLKQALEGI